MDQPCMHSIRAGLVVAALVLLPVPSATAQPYHLEDTLRGATTGGTASGGSFGTEGWTVTAVDDQIWYALPRLTSGYIEFTVANITLGNLPLGDHEIFAMYEDGYGIGEPIHYAPEFRVNHYKAMIRIYGTAEPDRAGSIKLMWGMCPSGAPGHSTCGCGSFFEEPFDDPGPWTGAPVRMRIEWGGGTTRLLRDGIEVVGVDWSGSGLSFGPSELHMMLGSPRNDGGLAAMPIGAVFSDLVVDGQMGPLATCPGTTTPDAGPGADAGSCGTTGAASADGTAATWEAGVFPDARDLNTEGDASGPTAIIYLRFPAASGPVASATLTLNTSSDGSAAGGSGQICRVDGGAWDEATLTWSTRPTVSTTCSGGARAVSASEVVTWDVTALVAPGGDINLAVVSMDDNGAHYLSREAGGCALGPRLDVVLAPGLDGDLAMDAGVALDGGSAMDAAGIDGGAAARTDAADGRRALSPGCGCAVGAHDPPIALVALGVLAVALARRARR